MISKSQIKLVTSLHHKKFRRQHGLFIAEGEKVVAELLDSDITVRNIFLTEEFYKSTFRKWKVKPSAQLEITSPAEWQR
jgi:TrmH family RNA methyltransferase